MKECIATGPTVDEAVSRGLKDLGLRRDQVDVHVLDERASGLFSMLGFRRVRVRLVEKGGRVPVVRSGVREGRGARPDGDRREDAGRSPDRRNGDRDGRGGERSRRGPRPEHGNRNDSNDRRGDRSSRRDGPREGGRRQDDQNTRPPRPEERRRDARPEEAMRRARPDRRPERPPRPSASADAARTEGARPETTPRPEKPPRPPREIPTVESQLNRWRDLLGWDDLRWTIATSETGVDVELTTSRVDRLSGPHSRVLDALEYLFNLVRTGGATEDPPIHFRLAGLPDRPRRDGGIPSRKKPVTPDPVDTQAASPAVSPTPTDESPSAPEETLAPTSTDPRPMGDSPIDEAHLAEEALFAADEVRRTGRVYRLDPMPTEERRVIHQILKDDPEVETVSEGEGPFRKVVVIPRRKK